MSEHLKTQSDEKLMESYQMGSEAAFDILFQRHSGRVFGFLARRVTLKNAAEDLLQEVFFKLHRSKHLYNSTLPFSPWLFSVTRSVLLDFAKKKNLEDPSDIQYFDKIASEISPEENDGRLNKALEVLPLAQRQVVSQRVYDEQTFEEIATRLSTSPDNARQLFSRGVKKLREALGRKE
ncbi:MAG: sigma-70 family RNA polymerase sigma factor [Proteobacteria bacterium]|jgi:RNA polymerase sigma-70 factor (ECF subfamily)|nr:sigma-70 family RNA polymerase sigma factor [Pseudomonadota bacterium]